MTLPRPSLAELRRLAATRRDIVRMVLSPMRLLGPVLRQLGTFAVAVPSPAGLETATRDGAVVYEREAYV